ncbi:nucleotidyl cyclase domain-containing protein [Nocardioides donggukensis]|uniref:GGDEF domain-containing protein n=1 Tax=Nocardioides donggukensis TaxID=2774019 RepID=A0A927K476_9ACTN|nr:hypothetical protein [Nocardioides donggukensis]MBD8870144.1 hypothetical protein [Nocardioides donggukensis]
MDGPEATLELPEHVRTRIPARFEAVGEALASGSGSTRACEVAAQALARDGASLDEVLAGLRATAQATIGSDPDFADTQTMCVAWSEATLAYLHQLSCEDPLTGLASLSHVRSRISELYRARAHGSRPLQESHGLIVIDLPDDRPGEVEGDSFSRAMRLVRLGERARAVFSGEETIGRLGTNRIVVVAQRDPQLGRRVAILRTMLAIVEFPTRVWIEGLPSTDHAAAMLLDELARP